MLTCLAFVALAETMPQFMALPRGSQRLETGHISDQAIEDTRTFLKAEADAHYYLIESKFGPLKRYVEKVTQRGLSAEFCGIMHADFTETSDHQWAFRGNLTEDNGSFPVHGLVDTSKSYFYNHVTVTVPELLHLEVSELPLVDLSTLDLSSVAFCEDSGMNISCGHEEDLSHLKL